MLWQQSPPDISSGGFLIFVLTNALSCSIMYHVITNEGIAQLVEHLLDVQGVIGSSPIIFTNMALYSV